MKKFIYILLLLPSLLVSQSFEDLMLNNQQQNTFIPTPVVTDYPPQIVLSEGGYWTSYSTPVSTPSYLVPFQDAETDMWITRISDGTNAAFETLGDVNQIRHTYSKRSAWNVDGSYLLLAGSNPFLLNGNTYEVLDRTNIPSIWSNTNRLKSFGSYDNVIYWSILNETTYQGDYNDFTFTDYTVMNTQTDENNLSSDDKYIALYGRKAANTNAWIVVFDTETESIVSELDTGNALSTIDWVSISQSGNFVVVMYNTSGSGTTQGVKVYDQDLNFLRHLTNETEHSDLGIAVDGKDVLVQFSGDGSNSLRADRLDGTGTTYLFPDLGTFSNAGIFGGHISCRNIDRPGYAYVSILESGAGVDTFRPSLYTISVKIDDSELGEVWNKTYSRDNQIKYYHQSHAVPNANGTKVLFASNWDDDVLQAQTYAPAWVVEKNEPTLALNTYETTKLNYNEAYAYVTNILGQKIYEGIYKDFEPKTHEIYAISFEEAFKPIKIIKTQ